MEGIKDLFAFLWARKKWWLVPVVIALVIMGAALAMAAGSGAVSPFIYTLF